MVALAIHPTPNETATDRAPSLLVMARIAKVLSVPLAKLLSE